MPVITYTDLASYPGVVADDAVLIKLAANASALVEEAWANPVDPPPEWVRNIAVAAATRLLFNPKGLQSWTASLDDGSRTERAPEGSMTGLFLSDAELQRLAGVVRAAPRVGSIRLGVSGWAYRL